MTQDIKSKINISNFACKLPMLDFELSIFFGKFVGNTEVSISLEVEPIFKLGLLLDWFIVIIDKDKGRYTAKNYLHF